MLKLSLSFPPCSAKKLNASKGIHNVLKRAARCYDPADRHFGIQSTRIFVGGGRVCTHYYIVQCTNYIVVADKANVH